MTQTIADLAATNMEGSPVVVNCERMPSGFANANYRVETSGGVFLLRHRSNLELSEVDYELDVLDWLRVHQFPAPAVIPFETGARWISAPDDSYLILLEWIEGREPDSEDANVTTIGRALGDLHCLPAPAGDWWRRENPIGERAAARLLDSHPADASGAFGLFAEEFASLREHLGASVPRGLIHGDLFPDNTLFRDGQLMALLDFEAACEDALLFDVAMAIHGFCFPDELWTPRLADILVAAYCECRPLNSTECEALPIYLRWCPLAMMGWHLQQLLRRPDENSERRAGELARRIVAMRKANWPGP